MSDFGDAGPDQLRAILNGSPFLTTKQVAWYLGYEVRSLYKMRRKGRGPNFVLLGRAVRYHVSDVLRYARRIDPAGIA